MTIWSCSKNPDHLQAEEIESAMTKKVSILILLVNVPEVRKEGEEDLIHLHAVISFKHHYDRMYRIRLQCMKLSAKSGKRTLQDHADHGGQDETLDTALDMALDTALPHLNDTQAMIHAQKKVEEAINDIFDQQKFKVRN